MKYRSKPVEIEARQWIEPIGGNAQWRSEALAHNAGLIVEWVSANGGIARFAPHWNTSADERTDVQPYGPAVGPRIGVMTAAGERWIPPGWYVVRQDRAWSVCDRQTFERKWEPA